jgi:AcrR family transcriptional regulator
VKRDMTDARRLNSAVSVRSDRLIDQIEARPLINPIVGASAMASSSKKRSDASAPAKLIETAIRLYGQHGIDGVSLRQISKAAGSGNNYAIQYHFGSASGLIHAILEKNIPPLEAMRERMLAEAEQQGRLADMRTIVDILYRPLADYVDERGERSYARFILALDNAPHGVRHIGGLSHLMPMSGRALDLLYATIPQIPPALVRERLRLITIMFLSSIFNRNPPFEGDNMDETLVDNVLGMATSALVAPVPPKIGDMLKGTTLS